jgi:hypothetical protein
VQIAGRPPSLTVDSIYKARPLRFEPDSSRMNQAKALLSHGGFPSPSPSPGQFAAGPDPVAAIMAALPGSLQVADVRDSLLPANVPVVGSLKLLSGSDRSGALARVKSVAARVNSTAFPEIELSVSLTDSSGAPVDGLDAASFSVKEQGAAVGGFALYSNTTVQARPRVLVRVLRAARVRQRDLRLRSGSFAPPR